jgi:hypothetical protein
MRTACPRCPLYGKKTRQRPTLPPSCPSSTIGGGGLNCRVRNGTGCFPSPMATGDLFGSSRSPLRTDSERELIDQALGLLVRVG